MEWINCSTDRCVISMQEQAMCSLWWFFKWIVLPITFAFALWSIYRYYWLVEEKRE